MLPKIDELKHIAKLTDAAVIGIFESKLHHSMLTLEIEINEYNLPHWNRNRNAGGVAFNIRNDLSYNIRSYFPKDRKNTFLNYYYQTLSQS